MWLGAVAGVFGTAAPKGGANKNPSHRSGAVSGQNGAAAILFCKAWKTGERATTDVFLAVGCSQAASGLGSHATAAICCVAACSQFVLWLEIKACAAAEFWCAAVLLWLL